jgi:hypothetical protein
LGVWGEAWGEGWGWGEDESWSSGSGSGRVGVRVWGRARGSGGEQRTHGADDANQAGEGEVAT